jgi:23S rRNA pseudouridine1911/1915/1917 synthase
MANSTHQFVVSPADTGKRLDVFLAAQLTDWSRSQVQSLIERGLVTVGSRLAKKAGERLEEGVTISARLEREEFEAAPEDLPLSIVYEDDDLLVVDKAAGMVVHVGAGVKGGTLVNALLHHVPKLSAAGGEQRPGIVHRLDKMTSGLLIVAKNDATHRALSAQFKSREIHKTYLALVHGRVAKDSGEISHAVGRDPAKRVRMKAGGIASRQALTRYRVVRRFPHFTLVEAMPVTGRTHQIRVHLAALKHPVVGDTLYGAPGKLRLAGREVETLDRTFLHAARLEFLRPKSGEPAVFNSPLPVELEEFLSRLENEDR